MWDNHKMSQGNITKKETQREDKIWKKGEGNQYMGDLHKIGGYFLISTQRTDNLKHLNLQQEKKLVQASACLWLSPFPIQ